MSYSIEQVKKAMEVAGIKTIKRDTMMRSLSDLKKDEVQLSQNLKNILPGLKDQK